MDSLLSTAIEAAEAAARVHVEHFGKVGLDGAEEKAHSDFVSRVDLEAQDAAIEVIQRHHPDHQILAEEARPGEARPGKARPGGAAEEGRRSWPEKGGYLWIIDPLDGTTNYLHGHPQFAASVGVGRMQTVEAGAVVAARSGERWWAQRGHGAFKNGLPIRVSALRTLKTALIGTGFPFKEPDLVPRYLEQFSRVLPASAGIRRAGSAALDLCYLAEGILDGFWEEAYLSPWDVAAGLVILEEAGGIATRLNGGPIDLKNGSVLAANSPEIYRELKELMAAG
ncbi:MAG: inositol monophosphatase family protein [Gemmatimonadota bacterium]|jgi:myo-inositol-1(or 4)-monophosphatase